MDWKESTDTKMERIRVAVSKRLSPDMYDLYLLTDEKRASLRRKTANREEWKMAYGLVKMTLAHDLGITTTDVVEPEVEIIFSLPEDEVKEAA